MNWEQCRAILWLRWRLTRNQLMRGSGFGAVIAALAGVMLVLVALVAGVGATLAGALAMKDASVPVVMFVWDGVTLVVLFLSLIAVLSELQRSESVDLTRLLHLPIGLKQVFVFNYLASLVSLGSVLALALMLGLALGLVISQGPRFLLALPLVVAFVFMMTAWIYCLRGWLLSLMVNPRRRRSIIMWITLGIVLLGQSPQLINLGYHRKARAEQRGEHFVTVATMVHPWVPLLWLPNGARGLAAGEVWPALWGGAGMFVLGWLGLGRSYRATLKFYRGDEKAKPVAAKPSLPKNVKPARNWVEGRLPWIPEDTAAMALAQFRSMTRAPEVRMILAMGLFMSIFLPAIFFWRGESVLHIPEAAKPFMGTGAVVFVLFTLLQLVCNQFGCDRDGFRGIVLLPTPRERLLLGKNLAVLPLAAVIALLPLAAVSFFAKLPLLVIAATALQFVAALLMFCTVGNLSSILAPFRVAAGSLKPTKQSWPTMLVMLAATMLFPLASAPVFIPPALGLVASRLGWPESPVNFLAALVLACLFAVVYWFTLRPLGRLLQRRETKILRALTEVME